MPSLQLKADYIIVKGLRDLSGWGWDDINNHIVVEDDVWDAYVKVCHVFLINCAQL
jgi:Myb/SANT-like DNA-binding domain